MDLPSNLIEASATRTTMTTTMTTVHPMANPRKKQLEESNMTAVSMKKATQCDKGPNLSRPHFRIDWRQLTYYQKDSRSLFSELFARKSNYETHLAREQLELAAALDDTTNSSMLSEDERDERLAGGPKRILNSLDGCFKSGELNAILGPSGAGKSTFLSALFGNKQEASYGHTKVTWLTRETESAQVDKKRTIKIAFLPQHDHLLNHLTVYETLMFASKIKNPLQSDNKAFHRSNVKRVAKMLKLTECFNTRCGRLSGGQYKRVSIGQELLSEPDVIILDEPTSGLDAMTCLTTIRTLKSIVTKHPISIILTIHQPDIDVFNLFDQIYVIAQGGLAIYEGPPEDLVATMARANLFMPSPNYNPARFIVENAFVADLESTADQSASPSGVKRTSSVGFLSSSDDDEDEHELDNASDDLDDVRDAKNSSILRRSISSLTDALSGKQLQVDPSGRETKKFRDSGRRPLLNIGIQTADGKLITSDVLLERQQTLLNEQRAKELAERLHLLRRLNQMQRAKYYRAVNADNASQAASTDFCSSILSSEAASHMDSSRPRSKLSQALTLSHSEPDTSSTSESSSLSDYSEARDTFIEPPTDSSDEPLESNSNASTLMAAQNQRDRVLDVRIDLLGDEDVAKAARRRRFSSPSTRKLKRRFDKRLSAKHNQSKQHYPIWYHSFLLTHRTWLSIVRDPIFFGIQFAMHTTIPILLALIFGNQQEEGCPQVGNFDLVEFAYRSRPGEADFIQATMRSIRQSIGNIGIIFFEMFVLSFAINCITALVFPLDMYVLLKEYRNGWYSLRSYFFGRTLADLPVPIVLHSMAMTILYYLTGQPFTWWRFSAVIGIVILASLVAQSVGLTIGALLMRSSQSAVLAAAGIVAPFFALSGFIVRIHTLPLIAQLAAKCSYLYHLLNGFIILRYGFDRCDCDPDDFDRANSHQIPQNLKTMASMWIGTFSNEFELDNETRVHGLDSAAMANKQNRTNVDPNIDIIDKLMGAFKMANSFGHKVDSCSDVMPYAMLDFNLKDSDILSCCLALLLMLFISRVVTFSAIYYKIRSFS